MTENSDDSEDFLTRWSRRKQAAKSGDVEPDNLAGERRPQSKQSTELSSDRGALTAGQANNDASKNTREVEPEAEHALAQTDFDALKFQSDYKPFMERDVPDDLRNKALRKLWVSDPILANMDGLDDYCEDYTDAATVPAGVVKTAYRIGKGFLSDVEVAEWEVLGQPSEKDADGDLEAQTEAETTDVAGAKTEDVGEEPSCGRDELAAGSDDDPWANDGRDSGGAACGVAAKYEEATLLDDNTDELDNDKDNDVGDAPHSKFVG